MKFGVVDNCPVPKRLVPVIERVKRDSGATLNSCDRSPEAEPMLRRLGKKSQRQLYDMFLRGAGNPANPPGCSTHERRNDGVAYRGWVGMKLLYWQVGQDWSNARAVVQAYAKNGWTATVTYPNNPREQHHVNIRRKPRLPRPRALRRGSKGPRVAVLTRRLKFLGYLKHKSRTYTRTVEIAVKKFQDDHHQKADGVFGVQTARQLDASVRWRKRNR